MKKFISIFALSALGLAVFFTLNLSVPAAALTIQEGVDSARGVGVPDGLFGDVGIITQIINTMLFLVGALAVIMIIFGGLRYVTSAGNSTTITAAKNTILYAIVGLVVAFLAYAAVNFILGSVASQVTGTSGGSAYQATDQ